jgi:site-specific DNA recombinase
MSWKCEDCEGVSIDTTPLLDGLAGNALAAEVWGGLPLSRRRAVVDLLMAVTIEKAQQGARVFDPESVKVAWKKPRL